MQRGYRTTGHCADAWGVPPPATCLDRWGGGPTGRGTATGWFVCAARYGTPGADDDHLVAGGVLEASPSVSGDQSAGSVGRPHE